MTDDAPDDPSPWDDALRAAALFLVDPAGMAGVVVSAFPGPVRECWLGFVRDRVADGTPIRKLPAGTTEDRLLGGLDLAATLQAGRPIIDRGLLAQTDGGILVIPMAERFAPGPAAILGTTLDTGEIVCERDGTADRAPARLGLIALNEGVSEDERVPNALHDRCAFIIDLRGVSIRETEDLSAAGDARDAAAIAKARERLTDVHVDPNLVEALCGASLSLGIASLRAGIAALRAARAAAALAGRDAVSTDDATLAARLVLAPRATRVPQPEPPPEPETPDEPEPEPDSGEPRDDDRDLSDQVNEMTEILLDAAVAAIPPGLLARLQLASARGGRTLTSGRAGVPKLGHQRGRPIGARRGMPRTGARLNVIETLRAAAPWQGLRRRNAPPVQDGQSPPVHVRREDFRVVRFKQRSETTTIFVVDASGSAALNRLAEAKGAVELLLADCYVRRDQVALIAFRGSDADLLLPPSRSLVRAKRCLVGLPGGGGTPLAAGLDAAAALAEAVRRTDRTPIVITMTDGQANITRDGTADRERATEEALVAARRLRADGVATLLVDISPRARPQARRLAEELGGPYLSLPYADAATLSDAIRANQEAMSGQQS